MRTVREMVNEARCESRSVFSKHQITHAPKIVYQNGFNWFYEGKAEFRDELLAQWPGQQKALRPIGNQKPPISQWHYFVLKSCIGGHAYKENAARFQHPEKFLNHGKKVLFVFCKMQDGTGDHGIKLAVEERHLFHIANNEILFRYIPVDRSGNMSQHLYSLLIAIDTENCKAISHEPDEIATFVAAGIEYLRMWLKEPLEDMVEQIDVNVAKLPV
jgi:hypothetical protein